MRDRHKLQSSTVVCCRPPLLWPPFRRFKSSLERAHESRPAKNTNQSAGWRVCLRRSLRVCSPTAGPGSSAWSSVYTGGSTHNKWAFPLNMNYPHARADPDPRRSVIYCALCPWSWYRVYTLRTPAPPRAAWLECLKRIFRSGWTKQQIAGVTAAVRGNLAGQSMDNDLMCE